MPGKNEAADIQQLRTQLGALEDSFRKTPSQWVNGAAIAFLPGSEAGTASVFVFVDPFAPPCEFDAIQEQAQQAKAQVHRVSRFLGLRGPAAPAPAPATHRPGDSASTYDPFRYNLPLVSAGTLGARAVAADGRQFILSSNHVWGHNGRALDGTQIAMPGPIDEAPTGPVIATRAQFVPLGPATWPYLWPGQGAPNLVDCALAALPQPAMVAPGTKVDLLPAISSFSLANLQALAQAQVTKTGRATGTTHSHIKVFDLRTSIGFTFGTYYFEGLVGTFDAPGAIFAAPGDSGAAVVVDPSAPAPFRGRAAGLVTARAYVFNDSNQFAGYIIAICPMDSVASELGKAIGSQLTFYI